MFLKTNKLIILLLVASFLLGACSLSFPLKKKPEELPVIVDEIVEKVAITKPLEKTAGLKKFKSQSDLELFLATNNKTATELKAEEKLTPVATIKYFGPNPSDSLREADILKQSNDFIFSIVKNQVMVLRTSAEGNILLKKIDFISSPEGLLLSGKRLIVYGSDKELSEAEANKFYFLKIYDLSSPAEPSLVNDYSFEGSINNIFIEDKHLYLLTETAVKKQNSARTLAKVLENNKLLSSTCDGVDKCFAPEVFYFDSNYSGAKFLNINIIDLEDSFSSLSGQVYLLSESHQVFSSNSSIFITNFTSVDNSLFEFEAKRELLYPSLLEADKKKVDEVELLADSILNPEEKRLKILLILDAHINSLSATDKTLMEVDIKSLLKKKMAGINNQDKTIVYKFRIDKKIIEYFARTEVLGKPFNQYSLLQDGGYFYLATKSDKKLNSSDELRYYSNIYVFDLSLKLVGKMENMASKEDVYGLRFLGNRAYLVSAEKAGSLFVVSLQDKTKPEFAGSLKPSGSDSYLRPIDKNGEKFISFSYDKKGSGDQEPGGLRLSLLDFSDLKDPRELDSYLIGNDQSDSLAFSDRDSFYYSPETKLLIFPASSKEAGRLNFSGYFAFKLEADKFELLGQLDHSAGGFYNQEENILGRTYFDNSVKRCFVANNLVYSFSNKFFRSAEISEIKEKSTLELISHSDDVLLSSWQNNEPFLERPGHEINPDMIDYGPEADINPEDQIFIDNYFSDQSEIYERVE